MNSKKSYVLYGASFNPPHIGNMQSINEMLETYDNVIVFPYISKEDKDKIGIPTIEERLNMLELFLDEFFPQIIERLKLKDLVHELKTDDFNTLDALNYMSNELKDASEIHICISGDVDNETKKETIQNIKEIESMYGVYKLKNTMSIVTSELREFLSDYKNLKVAKNEKYIKNVVGYELASYIYNNDLYSKKAKSDRKFKKVKF